jgi:hypothetical protein
MAAFLWKTLDALTPATGRWYLHDHEIGGGMGNPMRRQGIFAKALEAGIVGVVVCALGLVCSPAAQDAPAKPRPSWLHTTPIVIAENHDDISIFRRRRGGTTTWEEQGYAREYTEEAVQRLSDLGVTLAIIPFFKGFGLEAEKEHRENSRKLAAMLRKHGIRVGVYVGSTIAYETFLLENPEAESWFVPDYLGRPVFYDEQTFRKRVYFMHPGYREYIQKVLTAAEDELHADLIEFDNTSMQAEPAIFQHPLAIQDFRDFLSKKYSSEELRQRLGFSDIRYVLPPRYDHPLRVINDPLFQEWTDFRCQQLSDYYGTMESLLRRLNPEVAIECNPHTGISGVNTIWEQGVDYPRLLSHLDAVFTEEGDDARVTADGIMVSRIRSFKMAATLGNTLFDGAGGEAGSTLQMAESMAFGRQCLGDTGSVWAGYELPADQRAYIKFFHRNFDYYRDIENRADVAVLHSFASLGFNNDRPAVSTMLFEQALIQAKVPFDIIFDENLRDLSKYRVLVLADQECLSDEQLLRISEYVHRGGGLVATEHTSLYTPGRQRRRDFGLSDLLRVEPPPWRESEENEPEALLRIPPVRNQIAKGRVVYLSEVKPSIPKPAAHDMTSEYWKLPVNWKELIEAVQWAADDRLSLRVNAPLAVAVEITEQKDEGRTMVHLLNYDVVRTTQVGEIGVSLEIPSGKKVTRVSLLSPDEQGTSSCSFTIRNGRLLFAVPRLKTYTVAVIQTR